MVMMTTTRPMTGPQEGKIYRLLGQVPAEVAELARPWFERNKATMTVVAASDVIDRLKRHVVAADQSVNRHRSPLTPLTTGTPGHVRGRWGTWCFEGSSLRPGYVQVSQDIGSHANTITVPAEDFVPGGRAIPQANPSATSPTWAEWRELASELAKLGNSTGARFAVPSRTGNNDLDFWCIAPWKGDRGTRYFLRRVIGGRPDRSTQMRPEMMVEIARSIMADDGGKAAMIRYGNELQHCGRCGRHLTDEDSRRAGVGPDCAGKLGW